MPFICICPIVAWGTANMKIDFSEFRFTYHRTRFRCSVFTQRTHPERGKPFTCKYKSIRCPIRVWTQTHLNNPIFEPCLPIPIVFDLDGTTRDRVERYLICANMSVCSLGQCVLFSCHRKQNVIIRFNSISEKRPCVCTHCNWELELSHIAYTKHCSTK